MSSALNGLAQSEGAHRIGKITTKEELESYAAVVRFCTLNRNDRNLTRYKGSYFGGSRFETTTLWNDHLRGLLMERPEDYDAIDSYIKERGMHISNKRPVQALRSHLEESGGAPAIGSGWL